MAVLLGAGVVTSVCAQGNGELEEVTVEARRTANERPAAAYSTLVTALRFDPQVELQSRGLPEGQTDITIRGGLFENTGIQVGAATILDPQTGHYVGDLPLAPAALSAPMILTGSDNALRGFNAAIATVRYDLAPLVSGARITLGAGSDDLHYQAARGVTMWDTAGGARQGLALDVARGQGDGTVANGDYHFKRGAVQWQHRTDEAQTDLVATYQDKFYGWPGAYTGFATLPETDKTRTYMWLANHQRQLSSGEWQVTAYHRRLANDYDFDRRTIERGTPGSFDHETEVSGVALQGRYGDEARALHYSLQYTRDELVSSTDLVNGGFSSRRYVSARLAPEMTHLWFADLALTWRAGVSLDADNRGGNSVNPLVQISLANATGTQRWTLDYAETTQVPGYTALKSNPQGLFGGNPDLGREEAKQISLGYEQIWSAGALELTLFARRDDDLVDWTYSRARPLSRQANAVDLEVVGLEVFLQHDFGVWRVAAGITLIDKDEDYGSADVDGSFYAVNYARQRGTLAVTWDITDTVDLRFDNEWRNQSANVLRQGGETAYVAALSIGWQLSSRLSSRLIIDNLTDEDFQVYPGTPAVGRQLSLSADWQVW
jgi:hypothetical protein